MTANPGDFMNPISKNLTIGTFGELLVQLRLLQFDVQAAPPLKDSGNDLIAVRGEAMRAVQIKTTAGKAEHFEFDLNPPPMLYHALALVQLVGEDRTLYLDKCRIFLLPRAEVKKGRYTFKELGERELSPEVVDNLFPPQVGAG
jgi:hypothetical protein